MKKQKLIILLFIVSCGQKLFPQLQQNFYDIHSVQEIHINFSQSNWKHQLDSLFLVEDGKSRLEADVTINGQLYHRVGVRYKGFSSYDVDYTKNPFSIFLDHRINNQNYQGYTSIKLSNVIHDPSFLREVLSYEILRKYIPASHSNFSRVYVNDTLIGLYTNVEAVDDKFTQDHFGSKGNSFFKGSPENLQYPFGQNANLAYTHGTDTTGYMPYYDCESGHGWSDLLNLISILNNDTANLTEILNIDRTLWMHAFNYTLVNLDSYIGYSQNFYLYLDDNGIFNPIIWDLNMSLGSFRHSDGTALNLTIEKTKQADPLEQLYSPTFSPRPLTKNIFQNSTYRKMFLAHMRTIINENFRNNEYYTRAQEIQNVITSDVLADTNKFYSNSDFIDNLNITTGPTSDQYPGIKDLMEARITYLDTFPGFHGEPTISLVTHLPTQPATGEVLNITAKIVDATKVLFGHRQETDGVFCKEEMFDDGNHNDGIAGDSIYGVSITTSGNTIQYYLWAENNIAGVFSPERAEYEFYDIQPKIDPGDIVINEFMALNDNTGYDQDGEYDGWIELYNNTEEDLRLNEIFLSDDSSMLAKWAFPDTIIEAKKFLIVWADNDILQAGMHTSVKLNENGGKLYLAYNDSKIIDRVCYGQPLSVKTIGRYPNGIGEFMYMNPTYSRINQMGITANSDFIIYPNPANGLLYTEFVNQNQEYSISMYNTNGQIVYDERFVSNNEQIGVSCQIIDISGLRYGVYFVKVQGNNITMVKKLIVY